MIRRARGWWFLRRARPFALLQQEALKPFAFDPEATAPTPAAWSADGDGLQRPGADQPLDRVARHVQLAGAILHGQPLARGAALGLADRRQMLLDQPEQTLGADGGVGVVAANRGVN